MEHLECPSVKLWEKRKNWFENLLNEHEEKGSFLVSENTNGVGPR